MRTPYLLPGPVVLAVGLAATAAACTSAAPTSPQDSGTATTAAPPATATAAATGKSSAAAESIAPDTLRTGLGDLRITPVHHGTVMFEHDGKVVIVDPWSEGAIDRLPKADLLLVTDIHPDHFDKNAIARVKKDTTIVVAPPAVAADLPGAKALKNGEKATFDKIEVEAVPMYNKVRGPEPGKLFHDKGRGNGYILSFGDKRVYVSGDTECTDEMKALKNIDVAFVTMNVPYTMPPSEAAECIRVFKPKIVYPYHYRGSDLGELTKALSAEKDIEVRIRNWY